MKQVKSRNRISGSKLIADVDTNMTKELNPRKSVKRVNASGRCVNASCQYRYIRHLREARGRKEGTIRKSEDALRRWFAFTKNKSIKTNLTDTRIIAFKQELRKIQANGRKLSPGTIFDVLLQVKSFFLWLGQQPGYKSLINLAILAYFTPNPEEKEYRKYRNRRVYPTLEQVKLLVSSIPCDTILRRRDRALIGMLLLTGIRIDAIVSLTIGSLDREKMVVDQDPQDGVRTKFSKRIQTVIIPFDNELYKMIREWYDELFSIGFGYNDPLFPKAKSEVEGISFIESKSLSRGFVSASQMRKVIVEHCLRAGLPVFNPHSFRHACVKLAMDSARDGREIKAISRNLGHNSAIHVIDTYGQMSQHELIQIIQSLGVTK